MSAALQNTKQNILLSVDAPRGLPATHAHWLKTKLDKLLSQSATEFFGVKINGYLVGITEQPLSFWKENDYFVTQIAITSTCSLQLRLSNTASGIFLDESLGKRDDNEAYFKFKNITRLEAEILSGFCEFLYRRIKEIFIETRKIKKKRETSTDLIHLTIFYNSPFRLKENKPCGKMILSFPAEILKQPIIPEVDYPVDLSKYYNSTSEANVYIGKATITLEDLKKLAQNDVLIIDNSQLDRMMIFNDDHLVKFKVNPDRSIELNIHSEDYGGMNNEVLENANSGEAIWDNIQVEVAAEFKKIKLPLGELRNMTEGLVVEVASLVDNEVRLHIDGKDLAFGELVIVGDKYGVMINKVLHKNVPNIEDEEEEILSTTEDIVEPNLEEDEDDFNYDENYDDLGIEDEF